MDQDPICDIVSLGALLGCDVTVSGDAPIGGDLVWVLDEVERREMRVRFVRSVATRGNASGPPVEGSRLVVEVVVPSHGLRNDTYAICEFAERESVRQLVSIRFQARTGMPTPQSGQHTDEVLDEYGYDAETITKLRAEGIV